MTIMWAFLSNLTNELRKSEKHKIPAECKSKWPNINNWKVGDQTESS